MLIVCEFVNMPRVHALVNLLMHADQCMYPCKQPVHVRYAVIVPVHVSLLMSVLYLPWPLSIYLCLYLFCIPLTTIYLSMLIPVLYPPDHYLSIYANTEYLSCIPLTTIYLSMLIPVLYTPDHYLTIYANTCYVSPWPPSIATSSISNNVSIH